MPLADASAVGAGGRARIAAHWRRLNGPERVWGVDLARGLAVVGMLAAHLIGVAVPFDWGRPDSWIAIVDGRSSILFATIAGVSIGLVTGGRTPLQGDALTTARLRLAVRAGLLWLLGILLILTGVPVFVILPAYAILFLSALPFLRLGAGALFAIAGAVAVVMPFVQVWLDDAEVWATPAGGDLGRLLGWHYPFTVWIAFVLAGLGIARAGIDRLDVQLRTLVTGSVVAALGYGAAAVVVLPGTTGVRPWTAEAHSSGLFEVVGSGGFALAVLAASLLACRTALVWVVLPLRAVGAMPLTAYAGQLVAWALIAAAVLGRPGDLTGFRALEPFWPMTLVLIVACTAWALLVGRGPLEWVLDRSARFVVRRR